MQTYFLYFYVIIISYIGRYTCLSDIMFSKNLPFFWCTWPPLTCPKNKKRKKRNDHSSYATYPNLKVVYNHTKYIYIHTYTNPFHKKRIITLPFFFFWYTHLEFSLKFHVRIGIHTIRVVVLARVFRHHLITKSIESFQSLRINIEEQSYLIRG